MIIKKTGSELTDLEYSQIKKALQREFNFSLASKEKINNKVFFLLKEKDIILAIGALRKVYPVIFDNKTYTLYGFVHVVANIKSKGYGKQVITTMKEYLNVQDQAGIGFCMPRNKVFYEKCGLNFINTSTQRFVYIKGDERTTNMDGQIIFYQDSSEHLFEKILLKSTYDVFLPDADLW